MVDKALAKSFEGIGEEYDRYRPGFPVEAREVIVPSPVDVALDLGAGTGKFTALLMPVARRVIAVEPSAPMLDVLRVNFPDVEAHPGTAEDIPVADGSIDVLTVAQAFHWFDRDPACAEIHRALAPGGTLGLLWNRANGTCRWDRACSAIVHSWVDADAAETDAVEPEDLPGFVFERHETVRWTERIDRIDYIARWTTVSGYLVADDAERAVMIERIERVLDSDPETAGHAELTLPQLTDVFVYRALGG